MQVIYEGESQTKGNIHIKTHHVVIMRSQEVDTGNSQHMIVTTVPLLRTSPRQVDALLVWLHLTSFSGRRISVSAAPGSRSHRVLDLIIRYEIGTSIFTSLSGLKM